MDFIELCKRRFSARKFTAEAVSSDDLQYVLEAVRLAPSACNRQPWKFVVIQSDEAKAKIQQCYDREWFMSAPLYILCMRDKERNWVRGDGKQHGDIDVAIAVEHLCLAAADKGLGTCWVCNYDVGKVQSLFARDGYEAVAIIPLGHIAADCPHGEKIRKSADDIIEYV
ncbi:MAG: nitroreductase family protein [Prevotella sp.]|nr:nitroreductase family protein [Prevotella sp.]